LTRSGFYGPEHAPLLNDIPVHGAMALFEMARTDVEVVHKENDRQRLKQLDVALQTMATQATRELRLAAGKFGKALA